MGEGRSAARCCPIPSANLRAESSAWSVGANWAAARRAWRRPSACGSGHRQPPRRDRRNPVGCRLDELLAMADIVSLHCPLNDATRGLIGARELALMKPDALLINTARGALIDGRGACRRAQSRPARRRGHRCPAAGAAAERRPAPRRPNPQSIGDAARRLGGARSAAALHRRDGRQYHAISAAAAGAARSEARVARYGAR